MEITSGQIWVLTQSTTRPDIEIIRVNKYSGVVYWKFVNQKHEFESKSEAFLKDHKIKSG